MGLDMYFRAAVPAPEGSPLFKVIEENLTDSHRAQLSETEYGESYAYVSGWTFGSEQPERLFNALSLETGIEPTKDSPSMHLRKRGDGYEVQPTIFYWRKANAIHSWFVQHAQNGVDECQPSVVHPELLADLIDRCEQITLDHSKTDLLETQGGFFFGSTEYDEWYFRDIEETAVGLKAAVENAMPRASHFIYQSSW